MRDTRNTTVTMLILICAVAGAAWASQSVNETSPVTPGSEISVENLAGSLTFEGWDSAMLEVTGTLGDELYHPSPQSAEGKPLVRAGKHPEPAAGLTPGARAPRTQAPPIARAPNALWC